MNARLGEYRLTAELARDAFGTLHRAVRVEEGRFGRHALIRRFAPHLLGAGLGARLGEGIALSLRLGEARGLAPHCRIYHRAAEPWIAYDLEPGVSLADLLSACRAQGLPLGLDHALTVVRELAGPLDHLHGRGLEHGLLVPSLVWVSYEGAVTLLDAPVAPLVRATVARPAGPGLEALDGAPAGGAARDLHLLGCLAWQMLTLAPGVPDGAAALLEGLDAWSANAERPLPGLLRGIFARMVGADAPYPDLAAFLEASGEALHLEDHGPSTFNLAFLVHTVLRERIAEEERALAAERTALWSLGSADPAPVLPPEVATSGRRGGRKLLALGAALLLAAAASPLVRREGRREAESLRRALAESQRKQAEADRVSAELDAHLVREAERQRTLEQALARARAEDEALRQRAEVAEQQARRLQAKAAALAELPKEGPPSLVQAAPLRAGLLKPGTPLRLRVFVDEQGRALRATVMEGPGGAAEVAAVEAALRSTFRPARREGRAVRGWAEMGY